MSSRFLLAALTMACCLVAAAAGAETLVVVESSATDVKVGAELADGATITVPDGARVVLVGASGQVVTLTGPFQGAPKTSGSGEPQSRVLDAVASLVATSGTTVGVSRAVRTRRSDGGTSPSAANTIRRGATLGTSGPRTVSEGSSARAVTPPTATASKPARSHCTKSRAGCAESQREWPLASAMRPSIVVASLSAT